MGGETPWSTRPYRITERVPTRETPFSLAYEMKTIIPVDISLPTLR